QQIIEKQVNAYIRDNFSLTVFEVTSKQKRIEVESKLISTVSWCDECNPSDNWLGNSSPKEKIARSGLWLVNELYKTPFNSKDIKTFANLLLF
ncbi:MAG: hypothetical protein ACKO7R_17780, partial [Pseudanabaena sp.]